MKRYPFSFAAVAFILLLVSGPVAASNEDCDRLECWLRQGDVLGLTSYLEASGYRDTPNENGLFPLHIAAMTGQPALVQVLLEHGANPSITDRDGRAPIHYAAAEGHEDVAKQLLSIGQDVNDQSNDGGTPIHFAAAAGHLAVIQLLVGRGADLEAKRDDGRTPLHIAAYYGRTSVARYLLALGVRSDLSDRSGLMPMEVAAREGHIYLADLLGWPPENQTIFARTLTKNVQARLNALGYDAGAVDGVLGKRTREAIARFQRDRGLELSPEIDQSFWSEMDSPFFSTSNVELGSDELPSLGEYIAYSLRGAEHLLREGHSERLRQLRPDVFLLGGINDVLAVVVTTEPMDVILVGRRSLETHPITLDDFVVALRARIIHQEWPGVSIDPTDATKENGLQAVRFTGSIENTQFGADLLVADYELKQLAIGYAFSSRPTFESLWEKQIRVLRNEGKISTTRSRFWFRPILPQISVREGIATIAEISIGVFTELIESSSVGNSTLVTRKKRDLTSDAFASEVTQTFEALAQEFPSFGRVRGLQEVTAAVYALENLAEGLDLAFWTGGYHVTEVATPAHVSLLIREQQFDFLGEEPGFLVQYGLRGGVHLFATALRVKAGDPSGLREAVLASRPSEHAISWRFVPAHGIVSIGTLEDGNRKQLLELLKLAGSESANGDHESAIALLTEILRQAPESATALELRGRTLLELGRLETALEDFQRLTELLPAHPDGYLGQAFAHHQLGQFEQAIEMYSLVDQIFPASPMVLGNRGACHLERGDLKLAVADLSIAIDLDPTDYAIYSNRALAYADLGDYEGALRDLDRAVHLSQRSAVFLSNRAYVQRKLGNLRQAISDLDEALDKAPSLTDALHNRALTFFDLGEKSRALDDYNQLLQIDPYHVGGLTNRGALLLQEDAREEDACADFRKACDLGSCRNYDEVRRKGIC